MEEEAVCRYNRNEGIQQKLYAVSGRHPREKKPRNDDQTKRDYQVATG